MPSTIDHLIINSPYAEPREYWRYISEERSFVREAGRRSAGYIVASSTKKIVDDPGRFVEIPLVNRIRERVREWREGSVADNREPYVGVTGTTRRLLEHWRDEDARPERRFFFCQLEAIETLIWLAEAPAADKVGLDVPSDGGAFERLCAKMATGSGKTIVMAMLITWHALNKAAYPNDARFSKNFLVIAPGLTVRNRLQVLLPSAENNYYDEFNIIPAGLFDKLRQAKVVVRNWHALNWETDEKIKKRRSVDKRGAKSDEAYAREVLGEMQTARGLIVINDEAHHAWRVPMGAKIKGVAKEELEEATKWIGGLDRLHKARGIHRAYDFSATPFTPSGSASVEENLFGWIVSDFGLNDAIESGLVKTPRVVVRDDGRMTTEYKSQFYHLYNVPEIKDALNKKAARPSDPIPDLLRTAYELLGADWRETAREWSKENKTIPPVLITVANRTETAARIKYSFDHNRLDITDLCDPQRTLHIDSKVLAAAEAGSDDPTLTPPATPETAAITDEDAASETVEADVDATIDDLSLDTATDEVNDPDNVSSDAPVETARKLTKQKEAERLRRIVDTIGRPDEPGEQIQHVISVGMLTEGWDARNVTHIMGLRAFSSQLLCEQVVGRGLRRMTYDVDKETGLFAPEYVNIFGVPFSFIPHEAPAGEKQPRPESPKTTVKPLPERAHLEILFPNVLRVEHLYQPQLRLDLDRIEPLTLSAYETPRNVELAPTLEGKFDLSKISEIDLEKLNREMRLQRSVFEAALHVFEEMQPSWKGERNLLFAQLVPLVERFTQSDKLQFSPPMFARDVQKRKILVRLNSIKIVNHLAGAIQKENTERLELVFDSDFPVRSTGDVRAWDTSKPCYFTRKSHLNFCVNDSTWEQHLAQFVDRHADVEAWVKNDHLGFEIRYTFNGVEQKYRPDFLIRFKNGSTLVLEIKGQKSQQEQVKRRALGEWIDAVNQHRGFGRWQQDVSYHPDDVPEILEKSARHSA